jgi:hypothetical protein
VKERYIITTIDTIAELFKDYLSLEDLPLTAVPLKLMVKPGEGYKAAIEFFDLSWPEGLAPLEVKFDIQRMYGVG